jgi:mono/diheme cytochrome c family protein
MESAALRAGQSKERTMSRSPGRVTRVALAGILVAGLAVCDDNDNPFGPALDRPVDAQLAGQGRDIFRFDTFGDEVFWTDTLLMHVVIETSVSPSLALQVGLKVDSDALPQAVKDGLAGGQINLNDPATTVTLLKLNAVVGVKGTVASVGGQDTLARVGITCALCHSTVDNSLGPGIGHRLDGWPNRDLNPGAIIALSPALTAAQKAVYNSWGKGKYDPRYNRDGINLPIVLPPAFGLRKVRSEIYTGDDTISYWNAYVAVTQMHGQGSFRDDRLGINLVRTPDLVTSKLPALREYQHSLETPPPANGTFDAAAAQRGQAVFNGAARCSTCHLPIRAFSDVNAGRLHAAAETGMEAVYATRSVTKRYRTTPLRGLWRPPLLQGPYFHDGSAATLEEVVQHYNSVRHLNLTAQQMADLVEYLKTL